MHKAQAKRMAWLRVAQLVKYEAQDWELNKDKYSRHDQIRFEDAIVEVVRECYRRGKLRTSTRKPGSSDRDDDEQDIDDDEEDR